MPPVSPLLFPHLRIAQLFGANTDVGKSIFATALCLASHRAGESVHYLKPVSTGAREDADQVHISRFSPATKVKTLHQWHEAVSPHLAAQRSTLPIPTDAQLASSIHAHLSTLATTSLLNTSLYLETAGGVHSPTPAGGSTAHLLRPLRLPTLLVGSSTLGGISTTLSAYDSLLMSGHDVRAILLFEDAKWGNAEYLSKWGKENGVEVFVLAGPRGASSKDGWGAPPERNASREEDEVAMRRYYDGLVTGRGEEAEGCERKEGVSEVVRLLKVEHERRFSELDSLAERTRRHCWWPFTQHNLARTTQDVQVIDSASGDFFSTFKSPSSTSPQGTSSLTPTLDGSASWWTQCLGHSHLPLARAAVRAATRYGHVIFPLGANEPSLLLSEALLGISPPSSSSSSSPEPILEPSKAPGHGWASRVFFSDDGSTGMEVALKMALASSAAYYAPPSSASLPHLAARVRPGRNAGSAGGRKARKLEVLGLKGSYHGDTIGAMDATEPSVYSAKVDWYAGRGAWIAPPAVAVRNGRAQVTQEDGTSTTFETLSEIYDVAKRLASDSLTQTYRAQIRNWLEQLTLHERRKFGALVIEPLVLGAGGMIFVDPLFQRCLIDVVREGEDLWTLDEPPLRYGARSNKPRTGERERGEWRGLPVIFDEVFVGLWRLGHSAPSRILGTTPDISVLAKILTGGLVPMAVTLASRSIFETFTHSDAKVDALLHGHSYTAHPVGCQVALEAVGEIGKLEKGGAWSAEKRDWGVEETREEGEKKLELWSFWERKTVLALSKCEKVESVMSMGTVLVVYLRDAEGSGYTSTASTDLLTHLRHATPSAEAGLTFNIHARPLGNVVYFMCSLNTPASVRRETERALCEALDVQV